MTTRRAQLLAEMDRVVPWHELCVRIEPVSVPDETTDCKFRHLLEQHGLGQALFDAVRDHLRAQGITVSTWRRSPCGAAPRWS